MAPGWLRSQATAPLLALQLLAVQGLQPAPAMALVPYVMEPAQQQLEGAGLGIAQAAARLLRMGQAEEAAKLAALTVQLIPDDPRGWVLLAEAQLRSNQAKEAGGSLARAKQLDPKNAGIWFAEGSLALREGQPEKASGLIREGLRLDRKNASGYFDLGNAQILMGQRPAALASFQQAASLRRDFWEAINNQALVLYEQGKDSEAIQRWRKVLGINRTAAEPMLALAAALNQAKPGDREALELAEGALAQEPNYVQDSFQKDQLWGDRLRASSQRLLARQELKAAVERAQANAGSSSDEEE